MSYPAQASSVAVARRELTRQLGAGSRDPETVERIALALSELLTNAVEASPPNASVDVVVDTAPGSVSLTVRNHSESSAIPPKQQWGPDEVLSTRGRGLEIVAKLAESVDVAHEGDTVAVTATFATPVESDT